MVFASRARSQSFFGGVRGGSSLNTSSYSWMGIWTWSAQILVWCSNHSTPYSFYSQRPPFHFSSMDFIFTQKQVPFYLMRLSPRQEDCSSSYFQGLCLTHFVGDFFGALFLILFEPLQYLMYSVKPIPVNCLWPTAACWQWFWKDFVT